MGDFLAKKYCITNHEHDAGKSTERSTPRTPYSLAMAVAVLLLAVSSFVGGTDHGIGSVIVFPEGPTAAMGSRFRMCTSRCSGTSRTTCTRSIPVASAV